MTEGRVLALGGNERRRREEERGVVKAP